MNVNMLTNAVSDNNKKLLILSYADESYYKFVIPFIVFAASFNENCVIEIVVDNIARFTEKYMSSLGKIFQHFDNFIISQSEFTDSKIYVNNIRFFQNPLVCAEYVYICDIDIIILDDICKLHLTHMYDNKMFYSNIVRQGSNPPHMSGLHFIEYRKYYPVNSKNYDLTLNDEVNLYNIMIDKYPDGINYKYTYRPVPGIHISMNRRPYSSLERSKRTLNWYIGGYGKKYLRFCGSLQFMTYFFLFDIEFRHLLLLLEYIITGRYDEMTIMSLCYGIDPYVFLPDFDQIPTMRLCIKMGGERTDFYSHFCSMMYNIFSREAVGRYIINLVKSGCIHQAISLGKGMLALNKQRFGKMSFVNNIQDDESISSALAVNDAEKVFTRIYENNSWGSPESKSGPGSTLLATWEIVFSLPQLFKKHSISFLIDAGCGDLNWMRKLLESYHLYYLGIDIVGELILNLQNEFKSPNISFVHADIRTINFPQSDCVLCRDCLFHLSYADIKIFMLNVMSSKFKYFITTSHVNNGFINQNIKTGSWRMLDLFLHPFRFPEPLEMLKDGKAKYLCMWTKAQLKDLLFLT